MILLTNPKTLEIVLSGVVTTTELDYYASYVDINNTTKELESADNQSGTTNGTTTVNAVTAPSSPTARQIKSLSIYNADSVAAEITVSISSTLITKTTLSPGKTYQYEEGKGWHTVDTSALTASAVKTLYESNNDTNSYDDAAVTLVASALQPSDIGATVQAYKKDNFAGAGVPGVGNDSSEDYSQGSKWYDTSVSPVEAYICMDESVGAAVWEQVTVDASDLGTMAVMDANAVSITGGNIDATVIGATTKAAGSFTNLVASVALTVMAGASMAADTITETTADAGVTVEGVLLKDGNITANALALSSVLTVQHGSYTGGVVLGADANTNTLTDATQKVSRLSMPHYTNAEQNFGIINALSNGSDNLIAYGGNAGALNAATYHRFYTASNNATLTGVLAFEIGNNQNVAVKTGDLIIDAGDLNVTLGSINIGSGSGATASTLANGLVLDSIGLTLANDDATTSRLFFASPSANAGAILQWNYNNNSYQLATGKVGAQVKFQADNFVDNLILSGASGSELAVATRYFRAGGSTFIGATNQTNIGMLDVASSNLGIVGGSDVGTTARTNATRKAFRIASAHWTNAEEPMAIFYADTYLTYNAINVGGGSSTMNAATEINFFTAANNTTVTGTKALGINSTGDIEVVYGDLSVTSGKVYINGPAGVNNLQVNSAITTSYSALNVAGNLLTTGKVAYFYSNSPSSLGRNLVEIVNEDSAATGATPFSIRQDAALQAMILDQNADSSFIDYQGTAGASVVNPISTHANAGAQYGWIQIEVNSVRKWLKVYEDPSA